MRKHQHYVINHNNILSKIIFIQIVIALFVNSDLNFTSKLQAHTTVITSLQFFEDGSKFATSSLDSKFIVWNTKNLTKLAKKQLSSPIHALQVFQSNDIIVLLKNGRVQIYNSTDFSLKHSYSYPNGGYGNCILISKIYSVYLLAGKDTGLQPKIHFYDIKTHGLIASNDTTFKMDSEITNMVISQRNGVLFVNSNENVQPINIQQYQLSNNGFTFIKTLGQSQAKITGLSLNNNDTNLYSVSQDLTVKNYSISPFNNMFSIKEVIYLDQNPLAINGQIPGLIYYATSSKIYQKFFSQQLNGLNQIEVNSSINNIYVSIYPTLLFTTLQGQIQLYNVTFTSNRIQPQITTTNDSVWMTLIYVVGVLILGLMIASLSQIAYRKRKQRQLLKVRYQEQQNNDGIKQID